MNRRNKAKAAASATVKPSQTLKQTPPLAKPSPSLESISPPSAQTGQTPKTIPSTPSKAFPTPSLTTSERLRREWKAFETWLSARRADRDKRLSERLKELMSAKSKSKLQQQPMDMSSYETILNTELADQARVEWLKRLAAAGLNEEDWVDITVDEMKAVEAAFAPPDPTVSTPSFMAPSAIQEWSASVPGGWDTPVDLTNKSKIKPQQNASAPVRSSPLSNSWGILDEKPSLPTPESLWDMHIGSKKPPSPPTSPLSTIPTPETLWETTNKAPPPPTPPTEPVSPGSMWETSDLKKQSVKGPAELGSTKKGGKGKPEKQPASDGLWDMRPPTAPPEPIAAIPTLTGNSLESAHNHGYMSPLLIELECDEFPLGPQDVLTDELVEESIRQWHEQAAEADIQLRRQLVSMHWSKRDWDELLGSHVQEMERNARTVVGHWKNICDSEKVRRLKEDKQRRLAGIRNVTSGNRRWGASTPVDPTPPQAPTAAPVTSKMKLPEPAVKSQQPRKGTVRKQVATVEDATSSEWEERSSTPSLSSDKSRTRSKESSDYEGQWSKETPSAKPMPDSMPNMWAKTVTPVPDTTPSNGRKKPLNGTSKPTFSPVEPTRNSSTTLPWDDPQGGGPESTFWANATSAALDDEQSGNNAAWKQGAASAWSFAMNAIVGDKPTTKPAKVIGRSPAEPAVSIPASSWSGGDAMSRSASQGLGANAFGDAGIDGRFTPWKPTRTADPDLEADGTKKMADIALQHLFDTTTDEYNSNELHDAMSTYTKAAASSTRRRTGQTAKA